MKASCEKNKSSMKHGKREIRKPSRIKGWSKSDILTRKTDTGFPVRWKVAKQLEECNLMVRTGSERSNSLQCVGGGKSRTNTWERERGGFRRKENHFGDGTGVDTRGG